MATTSGLVNCVLIQATVGYFEIDTGGTAEALIIWDSGGPSRVEAMWSDMLSDAAANSREVDVTHPNASAIIESVQINRTP